MSDQRRGEGGQGRGQGGSPPSRRRGRGRRDHDEDGQGNIRGPSSALSDFLTAYNISAHQIRQSAQQRRAAGAQQTQPDASAAGPEPSTSNPLPQPSRSENAEPAQTRASTKNQKATQKAASAKGQKKRKKPDEDGGEGEQGVVDLIMARAGFVDHCEICSKKFTVTPYTKKAPNGGLLCADCGRALNDDKVPDVKRPKPKPAPKGLGKKREIQSRIMDRTFRVGAKDLTTICVETLARNVHLAESLGDLPPHLIDKTARWLSKRRLVDGKTISLFVQPSTEVLKIYDGAKLSEQDLINCFTLSPNLHTFKIRNGVHFTDSVVDYLMSREIKLQHLSLHGSNLMSDDRWKAFLVAKGRHLQTLKVHFTDKFFGDEVMESLATNCPNLKALSLTHIAKLSAAGLREIGRLPNLEYLSLLLNKDIPPETYQDLLKKVGHGLTTLSLRHASRADDGVLEVIREHCTSLVKLRITECGNFTDSGFTKLFSDWQNKSLEYVDLAKCRHVDALRAQDIESGVGICSDGFQALMENYGRRIRHVSVDSARYITAEAFDEVFREGKEYPELKHIEISFCEKVTDHTIDKIFKTCPALRELLVFGCLRVNGLVKVPMGKLLIGVPNVMGMIMEGTDE
ncbi:related to nucleotide exsicion repair protein RAD7 [Cephalotrichum gorgonifer]|uniref:Related to nucleotide exsicion repair protein RAD7 n=1 Tax=Cephalotrichum gorgonifer TaxID=2041049 RepID=A0AAE8SR39_9PEZI|nr:related to nucleotide exsicion repair protein RAD7 [Cephalotrichum gorgonifer]